jgi:hypothetical protein
LLNGADVTDVPTDFSAHEGDQLEFVFTQHPARLAGTVRDEAGRPVGGAWILAFGADPAQWQRWSATSHAVQADAQGAFRIASPSGRYLVRAFPRAAFASDRAALHQIGRSALGAVSVDLAPRELKALKLALHEP